jgi:hypothetical protein
MAMVEEEGTPIADGSFIAYTVMGYLALVLHNSLFAPDLAEEPTNVRAILVVLNLAAGTWCFVSALRNLWKPVPTE